MLDLIATQELDKFIAHFKKSVSPELWKKDLNERELRRKGRYEPLSTPSLLISTSYEDFCKMIEELWALRGWHNKTWFLENQMAITEDNYKDLVLNLSQLLFGPSEIESRLENFIHATSGFGVAIASELLTLSSPEKYALYNAKSQAVLKSLAIDLKEHVARGKRKEIFLYGIFNKVYSEILDYVKKQLPEVQNFYELDAFFWLLNFSDEVDRRIGSNNPSEDRIIVVKLGAPAELSKVQAIWKKYEIASFGFNETNDFDPETAGDEKYLSLKTAMEKKGAPEGLIKKVASYVNIFSSANPNKDWVVAYSKGQLFGYGRVSTTYKRMTETNLENWNQTIGVKWVWLDSPLSLEEDYPNLYQECGKNASVSLVKKRSASSEFFNFIRSSELDEVTESESESGGITLDEVSLNTFIPKGFLEEIVLSLSEKNGKRQAIFDGPPGTGKTFVAQQLAEHLISPKEGVRKGEWKVIPCHGALTFEQIFQGLGPDKSGQISVKPGILTEFSKLAEENEQSNYVVILDELNRANIPQVFGPLLFLLEYRGSEINLPFGAATAALPPNLFIIATMNSEDRSAGLVDFAFRRRFTHWRFDPSSDILKNWLKVKFPSLVDPNLALGLFENLNKKLSSLAPGFQIGHSYFMTGYPLNDSGLRRLWDTELYPLLEEKFHYDKSILESDLSFDSLFQIGRDKKEAESTQITGDKLIRKTGT